MKIVSHVLLSTNTASNSVIEKWRRYAIDEKSFVTQLKPIMWSWDQKWKCDLGWFLGFVLREDVEDDVYECLPKQEHLPSSRQWKCQRRDWLERRDLTGTTGSMTVSMESIYVVSDLNSIQGSADAGEPWNVSAARVVKSLRCAFLDERGGEIFSSENSTGENPPPRWEEILSVQYLSSEILTPSFSCN